MTILLRRYAQIANILRKREEIFPWRPLVIIFTFKMRLVSTYENPQDKTSNTLKGGGVNISSSTTRKGKDIIFGSWLLVYFMCYRPIDSSIDYAM